MFIDETVVEIIAGAGGHGCHSYNRQKYIPKGKPGGGNGGRGGNIIFQSSFRVQTLQDVAIKRRIKGKRGTHGSSSDKHGHKGEDIIIKVPVGTIVRNNETGELIHDFTKVDESVVIAHGGRGGRGNAALASRWNPNPERAEEGKPGDEFFAKLTLKVMADVGLVGKPNAGKSTLLSTISHAHPKIADYPFTTLTPQLGIVKMESGFESFVMADIPGIIEGAHDGKGLGFRFLRHIERTRILAIMVDAACEDPEAEAKILIDELTQYSELLAQKPKLFVLTKTDTVPDDELKVPKGWLSISSATQTGLKPLIIALKGMIEKEKDDSGENRPVIEVG